MPVLPIFCPIRASAPAVASLLPPPQSRLLRELLEPTATCGFTLRLCNRLCQAMSADEAAAYVPHILEQAYIRHCEPL